MKSHISSKLAVFILLVLSLCLGVSCKKEPIGPPGVKLFNISELRKLYTGVLTSAPDGCKISGIVISDRTTNNLNGRNIYLQQGNDSSGICIRFDENHDFNLGDSIDIGVSQQEISEYNGLLQLNNVPLAGAKIVATGKSITPRIASIADINANFERWESTLVQVTGITSISGGSNGKWSGSVTISSANNSLIVYTSSFATFASTAYPSSPQRITGILTPFNTTKQLALRSAADAN
ncbi:MAG: DUF5689 domain-containing protein [Bacteroidota bacterium]|jgi:hypothetical protein